MTHRAHLARSNVWSTNLVRRNYVGELQLGRSDALNENPCHQADDHRHKEHSASDCRNIKECEARLATAGVIQFAGVPAARREPTLTLLDSPPPAAPDVSAVELVSASGSVGGAF